MSAIIVLSQPLGSMDCKDMSQRTVKLSDAIGLAMTWWEGREISKKGLGDLCVFFHGESGILL